MQNNFYLLRQVSRRLNDLIVDYALVSAFSQNKDELIIEFNRNRKSFFIKVNVSAHFSGLSFPDSIKRARKNSVDLFQPAILKKVKGVRQFENDRSFSILLEGDLQLLFKMHGNRSNVILLLNNSPVEIFQQQIETDLTLEPELLNRQIDFSQQAFLDHQKDLRHYYFTFGSVVWEYLEDHGFDRMNAQQKWQLFSRTVELLEQPERFTIKKNDQRIVLTVLPSTTGEAFADPLQALTIFSQESFRANYLSTAKNKIIGKLRQRLEHAGKFIEKGRQRLEELQADTHFQKWADLIMANMHRIQTGMTNIDLEDLYDNDRVISIRLRKDLNAQKNAELYYSKAKNQQIEIGKLRESISKMESQRNEIQVSMTTVEALADPKAVADLIRKEDQSKGAAEKESSRPYRSISFKGFDIWIGKNAKANDELTLRYSFKEDLWLHAKDVAGSHVLIKYQSGKPFPKDVIERAAELAAFYSKRKTDTLCPVAITPKKFVRKRKGDPAGRVIVEKETVILVEPRG